MILKLYKELLIVIAVFVIGWIGFTFLKLKPEAPEIAISLENENKLATILLDNFLSSVNVIETDTVNMAVFEIKKRLLDGVELTEYDYHFFVIENDEVNAFATLGGNIFINSGLLKFASNPEEVSAVLAHEIGHVEKRHVVNKLVKEMGITILFSIISGADPVLVSEIAKQAISSVFDRSQESEADQYGLKLLENSSINPRYMSTFFRKLKKEYGDYGEQLEFLMSHPNLNKRIKDALTYPLDSTFTSIPIEVDWQAVQRNL